MLAVFLFFLRADGDLPLRRWYKDPIEREAPLQTYQEGRAVVLICSSRPNQACGWAILTRLFLHLFTRPRWLLLWLGSRLMCCDAFKCGAVGQSVSLSARGPWCWRGDICLKPKGGKWRRIIREPVILTPSCFCPLVAFFFTSTQSARLLPETAIYILESVQSCLGGSRSGTGHFIMLK